MVHRKTTPTYSDQFILSHLGDDVAQLALQRRRFTELTDDEFRWALQQIEARQRLAQKLPSLVAQPEFWFPVRLSCEQCSSELTARYKAQLIAGSQNAQQDDCTQHSALNSQLILHDLTGGMGIDTLFLSSVCLEAHYVERDEELCRLAAHNFALPGIAERTPIHIHHTSAEDYISHLPCGEEGRGSLFFVDPARRDSHGGKVFRLRDCTPDVTQLLPQIRSLLLSRAMNPPAFLLKLSPMLDISAALADLTPICSPWQVHVVSVRNEVKEVLLYHPITALEREQGEFITAIDLPDGKPFTFTPDEERAATLDVNCQLSTVNYIYEPSAAILKAGAFRLIGERYGVRKLDPNTHLYASERLIADFPGRIFRIEDTESVTSLVGRKGGVFNIIARNYPLTADQLRRKYRIMDGGDRYLIATRMAGKPILITATRC